VGGGVTRHVIDLFAGPGGWDVAACDLGLHPFGIELDEAACATRRAAGHRTLQEDIADLDPAFTFRLLASGGGCLNEMDGPVPLLTGLIGSSPCPTFSAAGKGAGRQDIMHVIACLRDLADGKDTRAEHRAACEDERSLLTVEPLRWALALHPRWITLEQVPPVLPLWEYMAQLLQERGYKTWTGVLEAERYGVPQTRERAFLIASLDHPVGPPAPTHQRYVPGEPQRHDVTLDGEVLPWVSMAEALGWGLTERPCNSIVTRATGGAIGSVLDGGTGARRMLDRERDRGAWIMQEATPRLREAARFIDEPAPTMTSVGGSSLKTWALRANAQANAAVRAADEPAPTIKGGHDHGERVWMHKRDDRPERKSAGAGNKPRPASAPAATVDTTMGQAEWHQHPTHYDRRQQQGPRRADGSREAVPLRPVDQPAPTLGASGFATRRDQSIQRNPLQDDGWPERRPATTVAGDPRVFQPGGYHQEGEQSHNAIRVSEQEAAILQGFAPDYPWQGTRSKRYQQIGNAVPPPLARAVLSVVVPGPATARVAA
jgi:DNA (cytosine-5)-methyltransferase 1